MGYKPKRTLYQLTFEDPDLEGLEVTTRGMSIEGLRDFVGLLEQLQVAAPGGDTAKLELLDRFFGAFGRVLVSWNVEDDDDQPVAPTAEGLAALDPEFVIQIAEAWLTGVVQAPPPLPASSGSGTTSPGEPIPALAESSRSLKS